MQDHLLEEEPQIKEKVEEAKKVNIENKELREREKELRASQPDDEKSEY